MVPSGSSIISSIRESALRPQVLGFAAHWTWIWCVFWSSLFYSGGSESVSRTLGVLENSGIEFLWVISLLSNVLTMGALAFATSKRRVLADVEWLPYAAGSLTALGTLLIGNPAQGALSTYGAEAYIAGSVLTGVGSGAVVVLWGELFAAQGSSQTLSLSIASLLLASLSYFVVLLLPTGTAQVLCAMLPVAGTVLYVRARGEAHLQLRAQKGRSGEGQAPARLMLIALVFGLSFGVMKGFMTPVTDDWIGLRDLLNIVAIVVGVLMLHVTSNVLRMDFNQLTYQVALPLMGAGFLFLPLQEPMSVLGTAVHQCGYQYFYIVLWATWPIISARGNIPVGRLVAASMLSIQLGQFAGSLASSVAFGMFSDPLSKSLFSSSAIFAMLLVALFVFGNRSATTGWGYSKPGDERYSVGDAEAIALHLAQSRGLSPREAEVFALLARGRTRPYIGKELSIGDETVKSHVKNIYRKMGLHSQQEAIDLLEGEIKRLKAGHHKLDDVQ